jgi:circadian clock protein KaiB
MKRPMVKRLVDPTVRAVDTPSKSDVMYVLWLFVAGDRPQSLQARRNIEQICDAHLKGRCELTVFDVSQDFKLAIDHGILLTPTLLLVSPPPRVTIIGTLSDAEKVLAALRVSKPKL